MLQTDAERQAREELVRRTQFTCFTGTKVQILTQLINCRRTQTGRRARSSYQLRQYLYFCTSKASNKLQADAERQAREELVRQLRRTQVAFVSICTFVPVKQVNCLLHLAREELVRQLRRTQVAFISCVSICTFVPVKQVINYRRTQSGRRARSSCDSCAARR
jgi:hypothetical protein